MINNIAAIEIPECNSLANLACQNVSGSDSDWWCKNNFQITWFNFSFSRFCVQVYPNEVIALNLHLVKTTLLAHFEQVH